MKKRSARKSIHYRKPKLFNKKKQQTTSYKLPGGNDYYAQAKKQEYVDRNL